MTNRIYRIGNQRFDLGKVTRVGVNKFKRYGRHPLAYRLYKKKHPWKAWFGCFEENGRDYTVNPYVFVRLGADRLRIDCKSNAEAFAIRDEIVKRMEMLDGERYERLEPVHSVDS